MGKADIITKQYVEDNRVFADAFNYLIYGGRQVIEPDKLHSMDSVAVEVPYGSENGAEIPVQKARDELKYLTAMTDERAAYVILGIENQDEIQYAMPVKNMVYDALQYAGQVRKAASSHRKAKDYKEHNAGEYLTGFYKSDHLIPVITLVIYFGSNEWDAPMCLHDMFCVRDEEILSFVENYRIHLIAPKYLDERELEKFHSSLKEVLSFIKYSTDKQKLEKLLGSNENFTALDRTAAMVINVCTNSKLKIDTNQEVVDMCKAIADMRQEGIDIGRQEGIEQGELKKAKETALNLFKMGIGAEKIAEIVNVSISLVKEWLANAL